MKNNDLCRMRIYSEYTTVEPKHDKKHENDPMETTKGREGG